MVEAITWNSWLFIALGNKTIKALKTALLCPCQGDEVDLQQRLHCNLGFFAELCRVCIVQICFCGGGGGPQGVRMRSERGGPQLVAGGCYSMPLRRIWLAAISMTLMMKAMAKAQMRLFRTQVCLFCFWECTGSGRRGGGVGGERRGGGERREMTQ